MAIWAIVAGSYPMQSNEDLLHSLQALISLSTIGTQSHMSDAQLAEKCKEEMAEWFGADEVASWKLLRVYRIPYAQPNQVMFLRFVCKLSIHCHLMHGRSVPGCPIH